MFAKCGSSACRAPASTCVLLHAGFSGAKLIRDADVTAQPPTGFAALKAKFGQLLGGSAGGDPFYAVLAYKDAQ